MSRGVARGRVGCAVRGQGPLHSDTLPDSEWQKARTTVLNVRVTVSRDGTQLQFDPPAQPVKLAACIILAFSLAIRAEPGPRPILPARSGRTSEIGRASRAFCIPRGIC